jgi:DNA polymerase III delta prime subunit
VNDGLFGHGPVVRQLERMIAADRVPHAILFDGRDGVGKRTLALRFARRIVTAGDAEEMARFDRSAHDRFVLFMDMEAPLAVRRGDLLRGGLTESALLEAYEFLRAESWIDGISVGRGENVVDLLKRNPERLLGRRGIPFAEVLEKELTSLERAKKPAATVDVARALFSVGTSRTFYRRSLGIDLINGKGDGGYFRTVAALLSHASAGGWRAVIIDDAHKMTVEAQNAFLKTLEEPPPQTLLILVTPDASRLLETIRSRCARMTFDALPAEEVARFLVETQQVARDEAAMLAVLSGGSPGRALGLRGLDVRERRAFAEEVLRAMAEGNLLRGLALVGRRLAESGRAGFEGRDDRRDEALLLLDLLAHSLRDVALVECGVTPMSGVDAAALAELAGRRESRYWHAAFARTELATEDIRSNVEPRFAVEALLADICVPEGVA